MLMIRGNNIASVLTIVRNLLLNRISLRITEITTVINKLFKGYVVTITVVTPCNIL